MPSMSHLTSAAAAYETSASLAPIATKIRRATGWGLLARSISIVRVLLSIRIELSGMMFDAHQGLNPNSVSALTDLFLT
jgi:hypothetical protein